MIKRSTGIGAAALILSLLVHFFGISVSFSTDAPSDLTESFIETVALGDSFDDLADFRVEPVIPETPQPPDPPEPAEEAIPEPEEAETPTSDTLVESPNPRPTPTPDIGVSPAPEPVVSGPVTPEASGTPEPETVTPSGGTESALSDARITPPVDIEATSPSPKSELASELSSAEEPVEPALAGTPSTGPLSVAELTLPAVTAPSLDIIAALPPVTTSPVPEEAPPPADVSPEGVTTEPTDPRLTASLRPQLRPETPPQIEEGDKDQSDGAQAPTEIIESPLTAYAREGTDVFAGLRGVRQSRSQGVGGGFGPGNSDETNYAGLVLMHLNRTQAVAVSGRGWARVVFRINPDGSLGSIDILDGSGSLEIDSAAKAQTRLGVPFPRPPGGKSRMLTFVYRID